MNQRVVYAFFALALTSAACAEDLPGVVPPSDQLYYPTGMTFLGGAPETLAICNSNFDQRFNAGSIMTLSIDQLFAMTPATGPVYIDTIPTIAGGFARVENFCGDLVATTELTGGGRRLFAAIRGRNRLSMVDANNGVLSCKTAAEAVLGTDCSPAYSVRTNYGDPFAVAYSPSAQVVAVGHLLTQQSSRGGQLSSGITHAENATFDQRITDENATKNPDVNTAGVAALQEFGNISGTNAMAFVPGTAEKPNGMFLVGGRRVGLDTTTTSSLLALDIVTAGGTTSLSTNARLNLQDDAGILEVRGIVVDPSGTRAYVSVRYEGTSGTINSGLAIVSVADRVLRVLSVVEAGDELGSPALIERMIGDRFVRVVYVPDIKSDTIWVFDASTDKVEVISKIDGRAPRTRADGLVISAAHTLDAPAKIIFVERAGRTLGFVTNFANSTISVIDATNPLAPATEVLARFGQALTPDGKFEGDE